MSEQVTTISAKEVAHLKILYIFYIAQLFVHMDSHSSSDEGIDGFPQQLRWRNWWIPTVGRMLKLQKWIPTVGRMKELMDSHSSSDDRIGGFPQ